MPYQIRIDKDGAIQFRTSHFSAWTIEALIRLFTKLNERFPDSEGFQLNVERFHHFPQTIDRETFCKTLESGNPVDILKLFVTEEGFQQFQKEKKQLDLKEEEAIDDAHSYFPIAHSIWGYYEGYYLVELNQDQQHQYLLPGYQPIHSDNYLLLEYELYLSYLQLGDC